MTDKQIKDETVAILRALWTRPLHAKRIAWATRIRVFCDGGNPKWRWFPRFRRMNYDRHWGMVGFAIYLWGREINFSFGKDVNGLYQ